MLAQIEIIGGALANGMDAAQQAGIAVVSLVLLIVLTVAVGFIVRFYYRNQREERAARERREQSERQEREQERAAREGERKMYVEAAATANNINQMLMDRLEKITETHERMEANVGTQTEGITKLMAAIEASETTRAERYQELFKRQGTTEEALNNVATELHGVKKSVDVLTEKVSEVKGLTDADRTLITELTKQVSELFKRLEGDDDDKTTEVVADAVPAGTDPQPGIGTSAGPDSGSSGADGARSDGPSTV